MLGIKGRLASISKYDIQSLKDKNRDKNSYLNRNMSSILVFPVMNSSGRDARVIGNQIELCSYHETRKLRCRGRVEW